MPWKKASRIKRQNPASKENLLPGFPRLLTERQTADILGVSPQTLTTWRCTRRYPLRFLKVGGLVRYCENDVLEFLNQGAVSPQLRELARPKLRGRSSRRQETPGKQQSITRPE